MKKVKEILIVEKRVNKQGHQFYLTTAILSDNEEYTGASTDVVKVGDMVEAWFDIQWDKPKFRVPNDKY